MAVVVAFGSFLTTLLGGYAAVRIGPYRNLVLGLAAGLMLGVVSFDLLPEALSQEPRPLAGIPAPLLAFVLGFLASIHRRIRVGEIWGSLILIVGLWA